MTGAAPAPLGMKPRLRGVSHQYAFFVSVVLGAVLVIVADDARATVAASIYAITLAGLFGVSALYHRITWTRASARRWMRRLDHSMIFMTIAGTYTPFALLVLEDGLGTAILAVVWAGAGGGVVLKLLWLDAPKVLVTAVYVALGAVTTLVVPGLVVGIGPVPTAVVALGGLLYVTGAVVYATGRPDPSPTVFGYHEIFHVLVIVAAALQYAVVAFWVLPGA